MNIQIFGAKKCFDTKKAERYFKERKIKYQCIDLHKYGLSKGEYNSVKSAVTLKELINTKSSEYESLNMKQIGTGKVASDMLYNHPKLFKSPIVRNGKLATVGYCPEIWEKWE